MIVGFQGEPGAFSEDAARSLLGGEIVTRGYATFFALLESAANGSVDAAILPVSNSIAGPVHEALRARDAFATLRQRDEVEHRIVQCLVGLRGASTSDVTAALSHPVALAQCTGFFAKHSHIVATEIYDTAAAVHEVVSKGNRAHAAIASARAAALYGATVIETSIQDASDNRTRFLLLAP